ncbi:MAG: hypothetical protein M3O70_13745 [Actinomycetota bacterium]|nr:hypothetical protein [Actinomycetota bacterium]
MDRQPTNADVMDQLRRFLEFSSAETWQAAELILAEQPELGNPRLDSYLERLIPAVGGDDPEYVRHLQQRLALLTRCRAIGTPAAFAEHSRTDRRSSDALFQMIQTVASMTDEIEGRRYIEAHPELLSAECDSLLEKVIATARSHNDDFIVSVLSAQRALFATCRRQGVEAAFGQRASSDDDPLLLMQKAMQAQAKYDQSKPR